MRTATKFTVVLLAAAGMGMWMTPASRGDATTQPSAQTEVATGNISGVVMNEGKPVANARVGLIDIAQARSKQGKRNKGADAATAGQKRERPTPVATTMTDADGKFAMTDVKVGEYMVMAGGKGEGRGRARASISAGETASIEIQVTQGAGKAGGGKAAGGKAGKNKSKTPTDPNAA